MEAPFVYGTGENVRDGNYGREARTVSFYSPTMTVHVLPPASLDLALDAVERPEDCSDESCFRNGGQGPCRCEEGDAGTWHDGC